MKVYALCDCMPYEDWWIIALFSSKKKREKYVEEEGYRTPITKKLKCNYFFDEYEVR